MEADELDEAEQVLTWRAGRLIEVGIEPEHALELADSELDVHRFESLLERGCTAELAERILGE